MLKTILSGKKIFSFFICLFFSFQLNALDFKGPLKDMLPYIAKCREGSEKVPASFELKPSSGTVDSSFWKKLSDALKAKSNCRFYIDLSGLSVADGEDNCGINYDSISRADSLAGIKFPENLSSYASRSFSGCRNLEYVYFPKSTVHHIGFLAFSDCPSLKEIHLYNFDGYLDEAFEECPLLTSIEMPDYPVYCSSDGGYYQYSFAKSPVKTVVTPSGKMAYSDWTSRNQEMIPKYVQIKEVRASSVLEPKYAARNIASAGYECWVEGSRGNGCGETLELFFAEPTTVSGITIKNGFGNLAWYWKNNRVKNAELFFDDEKEPVKIFLEDSPSARYCHVGKYGKRYSKLTLRITDIYPGTLPDNDCCIDEICINAAIDRQRIYGAVYSTEELSFRHDPETGRLLRGLYEIDVGKDKVKVDKDGFVLVKASDWETGIEYWTRVNASLRGTLFTDHFPGTGGGHSSRQYKIFLNPDGRHYLFTWREQFYGGYECYDPELTLYVWENQSWQKKGKKWGEGNLEKISAFLQLLEEKDFGFRFDAGDENSSKAENLLYFTVYPKLKPGFECPVKFPVIYGKNLDFAREPQSVAAFGKPEEFKKDKVLFNGMKHCLEDNNLLNIAAAFNPDPEMAEYLISQGFPLSGKDSPPALELWKCGENNNKVRDVLLRHGAVYTQEMLCMVIGNNDREGFLNIVDFIKDYGEVSYFLIKEIPSMDLDSIKFYFSEFKKRGVDFNQKIQPEGKSRPYDCTAMDEAFGCANLELIKCFVDMGIRIPERFDYHDGRTPLTYSALCFLEYSGYSRTESDPRWREKWNDTAAQYMKIIRWMLDEGYSAASAGSEGENLLNVLAGQKISSDGLKLAELFIKHGADVNQVDEEGETPLLKLLSESNGDNFHAPEQAGKYESDSLFGCLDEEEAAFKKLLLDNGAFTEYALYYFINHYTPDELLDLSTLAGNQFDWYLKRSGGRNIKVPSRKHNGELSETSLVTELVYMYDRDRKYDVLIQKLLDAGFSADGEIYSNWSYDPVTYFLDNKLERNFTDSERKFLTLMLEKRGEKGSRAISEFLYKAVKHGIDYSLSDEICRIAEFLIENGADWKYSAGETLNGVKIKNCAWLLLAGGEDLWDFEYEYLEDAYDDDDYVFHFDESKLRKDELDYLDMRAAPYVELARYFIKLGAGDILTRRAFLNAKVPERIISRIFK